MSPRKRTRSKPPLFHILNREEYKKWDLVRSYPDQYPDYAPFGKAWGKDPNGKSHETRLLPIAGPPNKDQIWPYPEIGEDWERKPEKWEEGLFEDQWKALNSELVRDVRLVKPLGKGGWGKVFEITAQFFVQNLQQWMRFRFAMKVIRHEELTRSSVEASFADMHALRYLRHENICNMAEILGVPDSQTGFPYSVVCLIIERCDGDLNNLYSEAETQKVGKEFGASDLARWILPLNLSRHWFAQIARGLDYLHSNGVAHQDMKLANIVYRYGLYESNSFEDRFLSSTFKLTDFGNARLDLTDSRAHRSRFESDINWLYLLWYTTGIPAPKESFTEPLHFASKCRFGKLRLNELDEWITPNIIDLCGKIGVSQNKWTASQILHHPWLQNNDEPRTEPFILREKEIPFVPINIQPHLYQNWDNQRETPDLYPDYSPFGQWHSPHRVWDQQTQSWNFEIFPIQGPASAHDLIGHDPAHGL